MEAVGDVFFFGRSISIDHGIAGFALYESNLYPAFLNGLRLQECPAGQVALLGVEFVDSFNDFVQVGNRDLFADVFGGDGIKLLVSEHLGGVGLQLV